MAPCVPFLECRFLSCLLVWSCPLWHTFNMLPQFEIIFICFQEPSLYTVKAVFILDNDGNRLLSKVECDYINFIFTLPVASSNIMHSIALYSVSIHMLLSWAKKKETFMHFSHLIHLFPVLRSWPLPVHEGTEEFWKECFQQDSQSWQ